MDCSFRSHYGTNYKITAPLATLLERCNIAVLCVSNLKSFLFLACEYTRLSFAPATTCEMHIVAGPNERRLYSSRFARSSGSEREAAVFAGYLFFNSRSVFVSMAYQVVFFSQV